MFVPQEADQFFRWPSCPSDWFWQKFCISGCLFCRQETFQSSNGYRMPSEAHRTRTWRLRTFPVCEDNLPVEKNVERHSWREMAWCGKSKKWTAESCDKQVYLEECINLRLLRSIDINLLRQLEIWNESFSGTHILQAVQYLPLISWLLLQHREKINSLINGLTPNNIKKAFFKPKIFMHFQTPTYKKHFQVLKYVTS